MASVPTTRADFTCLDETDLPAHIRGDVEEVLKQWGTSSEQDRMHVEREIKLQVFFGGRDVAYLPTRRGLVIVAAGDMTSPEFEQALNTLSRAERQTTTIYSPDPWNTSTSSILIPSSDEA
jgi:hypothetical protein